MSKINPRRLCYKLTTENNTTGGDHYPLRQWVPGEWVQAHYKADIAKEAPLCSGYFLHWYTSPVLAVLLNSEHANIRNPRLWLAEYRGYTRQALDLKAGSYELRILQQLELPLIEDRDWFRIAMRQISELYTASWWRSFVRKWEAGKDVSRILSERHSGYCHSSATMTNLAYCVLDDLRLNNPTGLSCIMREVECRREGRGKGLKAIAHEVLGVSRLSIYM